MSGPVDRSGVVVLVVGFEAADGRADDLAEALLDLTGATRGEEGCLQYDLHVDPDDAGRLTIYEQWLDANAHAAHDATPHVAALRARFDELLAAPPAVRRLLLLD